MSSTNVRISALHGSFKSCSMLASLRNDFLMEMHVVKQDKQQEEDFTCNIASAFSILFAGQNLLLEGHVRLDKR